MHHGHSTSNEDRYRCFVYEKINPSNHGHSIKAAEGIEFSVAQSGDATCNGLFSPMEGSRTMTLRKGTSPPKCKFPGWLTSPVHWYTLDYQRSYTFRHRNTTLHIVNTTNAPEALPVEETPLLAITEQVIQQDMKVICTELLDQATGVVKLVAHFTMGCQNGFICLYFHRRNEHIVEVQTGLPTRSQEEACTSKSLFDQNKTPIVTLVTSNPIQKKCPHLGKFKVKNIQHKDNNELKLKHTNNIAFDNHYDRWGDQSSNNNNNIINNKMYKLNSDISNNRFKRHDNVNVIISNELVSNNDRINSISNSNAVSNNKGARNRVQRDVNEDISISAAAISSKDEICALNYKSLTVGCTVNEDKMEFISGCSNAKDILSTYTCHGGWSDNGTNTHYLITTPQSRRSRGARRYCFTYKTDDDDNTIYFSSSSDTCHRNITPGLETMTFNITYKGSCSMDSSAHRMTSSNAPIIFELSILIVFIWILR